MKPASDSTAKRIIAQFWRAIALVSRLPWGEVRRLLLLTYTNWSRHRAPRLGAALAFYAILSLTPLLIVALKVAAIAYGEQAAHGQLRWQLQDLMGMPAAALVEDSIRNASQPTSGVLAGALGLLTLFFGASTVVSELRDALNTVWEVAPPQEETTIESMKSMFRDRVHSSMLVLGTGLLLLVSLVANTYLAGVGRFFSSMLPTPEWVLQTSDAIISWLIISFLFALLFRVLPDVTLQWSDVAVGSLVTGALFSVGKLLIGMYLGKSSVGSAFGAAGSIVALLVWIYYSAQLFFFGAEFTFVYATQLGSRRHHAHVPGPPLKGPTTLDVIHPP